MAACPRSRDLGGLVARGTLDGGADALRRRLERALRRGGRLARTGPLGLGGRLASLERGGRLGRGLDGLLGARAGGALGLLLGGGRLGRRLDGLRRARAGGALGLLLR